MPTPKKRKRSSQINIRLFVLWSPNDSAVGCSNVWCHSYLGRFRRICSLYPDWKPVIAEMNKISMHHLTSETGSTTLTILHKKTPTLEEEGEHTVNPTPTFVSRFLDCFFFVFLCLQNGTFRNIVGGKDKGINTKRFLRVCINIRCKSSSYFIHCCGVAFLDLRTHRPPRGRFGGRS